MAAPKMITLQSLNGNFIMNKELSDEFQPILQLQGIAWVTRKAIQYAAVTLQMKEYVDEKGVTHIDVDQTVSGGIKGTSERRVLDWVEREHHDHVFGQVKAHCRFIKLSEIPDKFLRTGWSTEMEGADFVEEEIKSLEKEWMAHQLWGFQEVDGKRYYVRNVVVTKGTERKQARLVYGYHPAE